MPATLNALAWLRRAISKPSGERGAASLGDFTALPSNLMNQGKGK